LPWKSESAKKCVKTYLTNELALKIATEMKIQSTVSPTGVFRHTFSKLKKLKGGLCSNSAGATIGGFDWWLRVYNDYEYWSIHLVCSSSISTSSAWPCDTDYEIVLSSPSHSFQTCVGSMKSGDSNESTASLVAWRHPKGFLYKGDELVLEAKVWVNEELVNHRIVQNLQAELKQKEEALQKTANQEKETNDALQAKLNNLNEKLAEAENTISELKEETAKKEDLIGKLNNLNEKLAEAEKTISELKEEIAKKEDLIGKLKAADEAKNKMELQLEEDRKEVDSLTQQVNEKDEETQKLKESIGILNKKLAEAEKTISELKAELDSKKGENWIESVLNKWISEVISFKDKMLKKMGAS